MPDIYKNKKTKKTLLLSASLILVTSLTACSSASKITDSLLYYPRKISNKTTKIWDRHIRGIPPNWQKHLDLGQPRRPALNPGGAGFVDDSKYVTPPQAEQTTSGYVPYNSSMPPAAPQYGYDAPARMYNTPKPYVPATPAYVPPPSFAPVGTPEYTPLLPSPVQSGGAAAMPPAQPDSGVPVYQQGQAPMAPQPVPMPAMQDMNPQYAPIPLSPPSSSKEERVYQGDLPVLRKGEAPPEPIPPWEKSKDYMGIDDSGANAQPYPPATNQGEPSPAYVGSPYGGEQFDDTDVGGIADPYEPGGFDKGFKPPSYEDLEKMGGDPFAPVQQKYIRVFEPMVAEYSVDESGEAKLKQRKKSFIPVPVKKKIPSRTKRVTKSMFPLEQYAPKSNLAINNFFEQNDDKKSVKFVNKDKVNARIDELIIKLGEEGAASAIEEEQKVVQPKAKFELPKVVQSNLDEIKPVAKVGEANTSELFVSNRPSELQKLGNIKNSAVETDNNVVAALPKENNNLPIVKSEPAIAPKSQEQVAYKPDSKLELQPISKENLQPAYMNPVTIAKPVSDKEWPEKVAYKPDSKLELEPIRKENLQPSALQPSALQPIVLAKPVVKEFEDKNQPIDIMPVNKVSSQQVETPLLELPEIADVKEMQPQIQEYAAKTEPNIELPSENVDQGNIFNEKPQIVVVTPAKNEYVAQPVVNIRKQFREYKKGSSYSGYRLLRSSRYSDRRQSLN